MPSCSPELHSIIKSYFGEDDLDEKCISFLTSHGFILTRQWEWIKPVAAYNISDYELNCLKYLVDEWDFGGIKVQ